jgi:hypothetical protein
VLDCLDYITRELVNRIFPLSSDPAQLHRSLVSRRNVGIGLLHLSPLRSVGVLDNFNLNSYRHISQILAFTVHFKIQLVTAFNFSSGVPCFRFKLSHPLK